MAMTYKTVYYPVDETKIYYKKKISAPQGFIEVDMLKEEVFEELKKRAFEEMPKKMERGWTFRIKDGVASFTAR